MLRTRAEWHRLFDGKSTKSLLTYIFCLIKIAQSNVSSLEVETVAGTALRKIYLNIVALRIKLKECRMNFNTATKKKKINAGLMLILRGLRKYFGAV